MATLAKGDVKEERKNNNKNRRIVHLYEANAFDLVIKGLVLAKSNVAQEEEEIQEPFMGETKFADIPVADLENLTVSDKMTCSCCVTSFADRNEQMQHYKTDWHRFNLKQKLRGSQVVTEEAFESMTGDISSISGSDSETDSADSESEKSKTSSPAVSRKDSKAKSHDRTMDTQQPEHFAGMMQRHPKVFFRNAEGELFSVYRCVVHSKKNQPSSSEDMVRMVTELPRRLMWAIIMTGGGHFAAAIFDRDTVLAHKTFHRYVVRAKRGTAQSARDSQGGNIHSAGASLRRYNEAALTQNIKDLLAAWSEDLKKCTHIFLRAPSHNKAIFFGGKQSPLDKNDARLCMIPFPTRRPTFREISRVHGILTSIECYGTEADITQHIQMTPKTQRSKVGHQETTGAGHASPQKDAGCDSEIKFKANRPEKNIQQSDSEYEDDLDPGLDIDNQVMGTANMKDFEFTKKPKRKRAKDKGKKIVPPQIPADAEGIMQYDEETKRLRNTLYTACKVGNTQTLTQLLATCIASQNSMPITSPSYTNTSKEGTTTGNASGQECIEDGKGSDKKLENSAEAEMIVRVLQQPFGDHGSTLLHLAASMGHKAVIGLLLQAGADPATKDGQGQTAYMVSVTKDIRNEFRRFMAKFPDKYDYAAAQVPGPLTEEMESEKKAREAERKKAQKKAKKERLKGQKEEEAKQRVEEAEQRRFVALSDREKRALAAERRFQQQQQAEGKNAPVMSRCWQCGVDITGKVPFEYFDFKFCTPKCLKAHKLANPKR